jgi:hypothetical protein
MAGRERLGNCARVFRDECPIFADGALFVDEFIDGLDRVRPALRARFLIPI